MLHPLGESAPVLSLIAAVVVEAADAVLVPSAEIHANIGGC